MATGTNMFSDKETNNWIKTSIALNITKEGLKNFIETEMRKVQAIVGRSCGQCTIENLTPCPTQNLCKKKKRQICTFHNSYQPRQCQICEQVKHNIIANHRYKGPSWKNTKAELWINDWWEIAKCFLPPDGYSAVSSIQKSDFNGVISIMLNCSHFDTCLSTSLNPKPPDPLCPLERVRQIGRELRHSADCKVADADLQDYFQTLNLLLVDPPFLVHDQSAASAQTKLNDLQNDRLTLSELGTLLKDAQQTLANANEVGEQFSKNARRTLAEGLSKIEELIQAGEKRIHEKTVEAENKITNTMQGVINHIECKRNESIYSIHERTKQLNNSLEDTSQKAESTILQQTKNSTSHIEKITRDGVKTIEDHTRDGIGRIQQEGSEQAIQAYKLGVKEMIRGLKQLYNDRFSHVPSSPLNDSFDVKLNDVYMPPNLHMNSKENGAFRKTEKRVTKYKDLFTTEMEFNRRIFIQGKAGCGKSTFTAKLALAWCGKKTNKQFKNNTYDFDDIPRFKFVFHIILRNSVNQHDIVNMIKEQVIDFIYGEEDRANAYKLLNEIMKKERCLVVLDGLDEWRSIDEKHALPYLVAFHRQCVLLITTRPWKLADGKIKHSDIDTLLEMDGINDPIELSYRILARLVDVNDIENKYTAFKSYVRQHKLENSCKAPMLLSLVLSSWLDGMELTGSRCKLYSLLLDSLLKKPTKESQCFQEPPFPCFEGTQYIQPNMEHLKVLSRIAFKFLFSVTKENSLVFSETELVKQMTREQIEHALKSGILSQTSKSTLTRPSSAFSFIHKSVQEFFAACYISWNMNVIDDVVSEYLMRFENAYLDISDVFIFVCGLNISAAHKLSSLMDERDYAQNNQKHVENLYFPTVHSLQNILLLGYKEAKANNNSNVRLVLSQFAFKAKEPDDDLQHLWNANSSNVRVVFIGSKCDYFCRGCVSVNVSCWNAPLHIVRTCHVCRV